jgi:hypothetical protein
MQKGKKWHYRKRGIRSQENTLRSHHLEDEISSNTLETG